MGLRRLSFLTDESKYVIQAIELGIDKQFAILVLERLRWDVVFAAERAAFKKDIVGKSIAVEWFFRVAFGLRRWTRGRFDVGE